MSNYRMQYKVRITRIILDYVNKVDFFTWNTSFGFTPNVIFPVVLVTISENAVRLWGGGVANTTNSA
jgi:hypothetical protein